MSVDDNNELRRRIDEVLFYVWDPIGVSDEPCARGEYASYVSKALDLVEQNDDIGPISSYLADIMKSQMGLSPNKEQCDYIAKLLLKHKQAIKDRCV
jgi:hypothetical protein